MAGVKEYWFDVHKNDSLDATVPFSYTSCIFQQQWYEYLKNRHRSVAVEKRLHLQHVDYLTRLLLDNLLSHDLIMATRCVTSLSGMMKRVPELIWRTGCEVLLSTHGNHQRRIQFFKFIFMMSYRHQEEIILLFTIYLTEYHNSITEAYELLNSKFIKKTLNTNKLLQGYLGLFEYILWKSKAVKQRHSSIDDELEEQEMLSEQDDVMYNVNKSLQFFEDLVETDGVWDIFILRQVELLMVFDRNVEAKQVLRRYREKNPENPNAHRYLYYFLKKQNASKSALLSVLDDLFAVDPTSELVNEYYGLIMDSDCKKENVLSLIGILFEKLDYNSCKSSLQDWKALAHTLDWCYHGNVPYKDIDTKVNECWEERSDWWPGYHFNASSLMTTLRRHNNDIVIEKASVAKYLLTEDCEYVKLARKLVSRGEEECSSEKGNESISLYSDDGSSIRIRRKLKRRIKDKGSPLKKKKGQS